MLNVLFLFKIRIMKQLIFILFISVLFSCSKSANKEVEFYVRGNCDMCKERIETTVKAVPGIATANWEVKTSNLKVTFDSTKTNELDLHKAIAATGHGTKLVEMNAKAHDELPDCCKIE